MSTTKSRPRAPLKAPAPRLTGNKLPAQHRATETYEHILAVTAQLLGDVGVERLSTNLVCAHAGLTPPALYRYFPNKYALLSELGTRLMQRQNALVPKWITPQAMFGSRDQVQQALTGLVLDTYRVTKATEGGSGSCARCVRCRPCRRCGWTRMRRSPRRRCACSPISFPMQIRANCVWSAASWWT